MQQDTKNKFAAILAEQLAKANGAAIKPNDSVKYKNASIPAKVISVDNSSYTPAAQIQFTDNNKTEQAAIEDLQKIEPSKLSLFHILWQEGSGKFDGKTFQTWAAANKAMTAIYNEHSGLGYLKVKVHISWENGKEITDRIDCGNSGGDFSPKKETIAQYLQRQTSTMYAGNLMQGDRVNLLSFEDTEELSSTTFADLFSEPVKIIAPDFKLVDYSEKAFAVLIPNYTELSQNDARLVSEKLSSNGGKFNAYLKCGKGWIFSKRKAYTVRRALNLI